MLKVPLLWVHPRQ